MLNRVKLVLRALFHRAEMEQELDDELRFHLEKEIEQNLLRGMSHDEARNAALCSFGGIERVKEETRDTRGVRPLEEALQDLRYSARMLLKKPGFTTVAVLTLALGIGASTSIFSIVDAVLLRSLPYPEANKILSLKEVNAKGQQTTFAEPNFLDVHARNHTLASAAQYTTQLDTVLGGSEPVRTRIAFVSGEFFKTLSVQPAIGRSFRPEESKEGGPAVAVVSHAFWQKLLGSRDDLSATTLRIGDSAYTIIGVTASGFNFPKEAEAWLPIEAFGPSLSRSAHGRRVIARLNDGVTLEQARADLSAIGKQIRQENAVDIDLVDVATLPLKEALIGDVGRSLFVILAAVSFLLLVACTNVANLLLAQASTRQREFAVRTALGATRARLARQFIVENMMLAVLAGGLGVLLSFWGVQALIGLDQGYLPRADEVSVDGRALAFTVVLSTAVAVVLGLVPLLRLAGNDLQDSLKESTRGN